MTHALSIGQRAVMRSMPVHVERYLSFVPATVVFSGQISAHYVDSRNSNNYALGLQSTSGTLGDARAGYSVWVGTAPGLRDRAILRMRAAGFVVGSNTIIPVGEVAQATAQFEIGEYVTIVAIRKPWPKLPRLLPVFNSQGVATDFLEYHDYDLSHSDQNRYQQPLANVTKSDYDPVEHAGFLDDGDTVRTVALDSSVSSAITGSIASRTWSVNGQSIITGTSSSTAIVVEFTEGFHWCSLTITTTEGKSATHWFPIWAHGPSYPPLQSVVITRDERSEWREQDLEIFNAPGLAAELTPGATLCSWEVAHYGDETPPPQRPTQTLGWSPRNLSALRAYEDAWTLTLVGAGGWLDAMNGYGQLIIKPDSGNIPNEWNEMALGSLKIDRVVAYILREYSTILDLVNLYLLSGNVDIVEEEEIKLGTQWAQVKYQVSGYLGGVRCDSGSAIWITPQAFYGTQGEQAAWPTIIAISPTDWTHEMGLQVTTDTEPTVNQLTMSGSYFDGAKSHQVAAVAPGDAMSGLGDNQEGPYQRLPNSTNQQVELNRRVGLEYARRNSAIDPVSLELLTDLDCAEPAWGEVVRLTWEEESASGIEWVTKAFAVTEVAVAHNYDDPDQPSRIVTWVLEAITYGRPGTTVLLPDDPFPETIDYPVEPPMLELDEDLPDDGLDYNQQTAAAFPRGGTEFFRTGPVFNGSGLDVDSPVWDPYDLDADIDGEIEDFAPDPSSPLYLGTGPELNGVLLTTSHAYQLLDVMGTPVIDNGHELPVNTDHTTMKRSVAFSAGIEGEVAIVGHDTADATVIWTSFSDDKGETWTDSDVNTENAIEELCLVPIAFYDFADPTNITGIATDWICGGVSSVGSTIISSGGEGDSPSLHSGNYASTRCSGIAVGLTAPTGYTWAITEVRARVRWEADAGWGSNPVQVLMSHDWPHSGTHVSPNMFDSGWPSSSINLTEGADFATVVMPSSYAGDDIGSIRIDMSVDVGGVPATNVNWYMDNVQIYGTLHEVGSGDPVEINLLQDRPLYPGVWLSPLNSGRVITSWPRADGAGLAYALCQSDDGGATYDDVMGSEWAFQGAQEVKVPLMDETESNLYHGFSACLEANSSAGIGYTAVGDPLYDVSPVDDSEYFGLTNDHAHPISISALDGLTLIAAGCSRDATGIPDRFGVFITADGGESWDPLIPATTSVKVRSVAITRDGEHWFGWGINGFVGVSTSGGFALLDKTGNMPDLLIVRVVGG